jgi:hypothetical protein
LGEVEVDVIQLVLEPEGLGDGEGFLEVGAGDGVEALGLVESSDVGVGQSDSPSVAYTFTDGRAFWKASKASAYRPWAWWIVPMLLYELAIPCWSPMRSRMARAF